MTEYTVYECDLTGRRARNKNVMAELPVRFSSDSWHPPADRTYHVHLEEALEERDHDLDDSPEYDDEDTRVTIDIYCYEDGEVVGALAYRTRTIGSPGTRVGEVFVEREDFAPYYELMASLIEELENDD